MAYEYHSQESIKFATEFLEPLSKLIFNGSKPLILKGADRTDSIFDVLTMDWKKFI